MNREIEFRAWLKENYIERYGWDKRAEELGRMRKVHSIHLNKKKVIISSKYGGNISVPFQYIELMQYTGLKDKNGVKIFEGDIVKCGKKIAVVKYGYHNCGCCHDVYGFTVLDRDGVTDAFSFEYCEVIGNIYENKELIS